MKKFFVMGLLAVGMLTACQPMEKTTSSSQQEVVQAADINWDQAGPDAKANHISFDMVKADVEAGAKFYDVRSEEEYETENFGITENLPLADLQAGKLPDLPKDTKIYVHCLKGIRSAQAVKILRDAGYTQVFDMGGIEHVEAIGGVLE
ncbi:rhodanese-like domain-containing protein [Streptococcus ovis]|uniref:rhodanese-like domain-containing protein n=1 Tax=Streptococcus ovis TaxID=82806 RepID=UPI00036C6AB9|nr:rhodanese-like domain-containing protein [Streptococcus ovis]